MYLKGELSDALSNFNESANHCIRNNCIFSLKINKIGKIARSWENSD